MRAGGGDMLGAGADVTRVVIIGAGIAGTAAALALHKAGFEVGVFEAHPDSGQDIGAFLTLASNGMRALAQFDAAEPVAAGGFPLTSMSVLADTGAELATVPLGEPGDPLTRYRCLRRADLGTVLRAEVRRRDIPIRHGRRLAEVTEDADGVTARFTDGSTATGDLLIGADGLNSTVRSRLLPAAPQYAGQRVFYGYTTDARPPSEPDRITMIRGSVVAFGYTVAPAGETYWFARVPGPAAVDAVSPTELRAELVPLLRPDHTPAADIVAATGDQLMRTNAQHLPIGIPWHRNRSLLIGDAAHAASPATGQGASMALEDAVVLAKALRDNPSLEAAQQVYDRTRRPRVEHNILASAGLTAGRPAPNRPQARPDEHLHRELDWHTPLPH
jgi:2-polyprenyl-6-methoxyphenol hydroxylase-like FAD-dependent oxidoreductase